MNKVRIYPSILTADFSKLGQQFREAESCGADGIHIDIMDGHFVEPITFGPLILENLREMTSLDFDVHMMVENPSKYLLFSNLYIISNQWNSIGLTPPVGRFELLSMGGSNLWF